MIFQTADQVAMALLGLVIAGALLLFARPTLRVGSAGLSVRNLLGYRLIPWSEVVGVSFPAGNRWARIDLPDDEYVPVMAIQAVDKDGRCRPWTRCGRCWLATGRTCPRTEYSPGPHCRTIGDGKS